MSDKNKITLQSNVEFNLSKTINSGGFDKKVIDYDIDYPLHSKLHSPSLKKIIEEGIDNTSDQVVKGNRVTEIKVNIERNGVVTIYNDGKGIPNNYYKDEKAKKGDRKVHIPELVFTNFHAGSNFNDTKESSGNLTAGCHGTGVKLTVIHSKWFELETVSKRKLYKQKFSMDYEKKDIIINPPELIDFDGKSYTQIKFLPNYERFEYSNPPSKKDMDDLINIIKFRLIHTAVFVINIKKKVKFYFNDELLDIKNTKDLLPLIDRNVDFKNDDIFTINSKKDDDRFINYCIKVRQKSETITTSVINGVHVYKGGTHNTYMFRAINAKIKDLSKKDKEEQNIGCQKYLTIVASSLIPIKYWGNQCKDTLDVKECILKDFTLDNNVIAKIAKIIYEKSKEKTFDDIKKSLKTKVSKTIVYDKFTQPKKRVSGQTIMIAEGDSAMLLIKRGLSTGHSCYTLDNTGVFSLGGVPGNISKGGLIEIEDGDGNTQLAPTEKFYESKVFNALVQALKIDPLKVNYTKNEISKLPFSKIIICVDADLDGTGNIASLVLQFFYKLWPCLYEHEIIYIWNSPIIRITSNKGGKMVKEFKFDQEYKEWIKSNSIPKDTKISYIKGLAGHSDKFIKNMFNKFNNDLVKFTTDDLTSEIFEIYFGKVSSKRKTELATEVEDFTSKEILQMTTEKQELIVNRHLTKNTKEFQIYAMKRTIPSLVDGFTPVRRKIFASFYNHEQTTPLKVFQAGGRIAFEYQYHHGDASLNGSIIKMCQDYPGSNVIPLLIKDGQVGSRDRKGKDAGSARYVGASLNKKLALAFFPKSDITILQKQYIEGELVEPYNYLPTIPLAITEHQKSVSYAWSLDLYPRDVKAICSILIKLCKGEEITEKDKKIPFYKGSFKGKIKEFTETDEEGKTITKIKLTGKYEQSNEKGIDILTITELPLLTTPKKVELSLIEDTDIVANVINATTDDVYIRVELKPNSIDKINKKYGSIEKFLKIEYILKEHINFINENGIIEHFETAYQVLERCFNLNKQKFKLKIDRELLLLRYKIQREKNIIRFIEIDEIEKIKKKPDKEIKEILSSDKFETINTTVLNTETKYTTEELITKLEEDKTYDYLMAIKVADVTKVEVEKRIKKLDEMMERKEELEKKLKEEPFPGSSIYISDINNVLDVLN